MQRKKLKVMLLIESMRNGGAEKIVLNYLRDFKNDNDIEVKLFTFSKPSNSNWDIIIEKEKLNVEYLMKDKIPNIPYLKKIIYKIKSKKAWDKAIKKFEPDIVHVHISALLENSLKPIVKNNVPIRFDTLHSHPLRYRGKILKIIRKAFQKERFIPICLTHEQANIAREHYGFNCFEIVHNGVDYEEIKRKLISKSEARKIYNIAEDEFLVVGVGRLNKIKNYDLLIDAFNVLSKKNNKAKLLIAGEGPDKKNLEEKIKFLNLKEKIILLGNLQDVVSLYCAADMYVVTSHSETGPLTLLEAQLCNLNCVASSGVPKESVITNKVKHMSKFATLEEWAEAIQDTSYVGEAVSEFNSFEVHDTSNHMKQIYLKYWKEYLDEKK